MNKNINKKNEYEENYPMKGYQIPPPPPQKTPKTHRKKKPQVKNPKIEAEK